MVKVLANGDIVPDSDPRAGGRSNVSTAGERNRPRQGFVNHADNPEAAQMAGSSSMSVFGALNQRLVGAGVPTWHIGSYSVQPIVSLGFLLSFLLAGFRGLLFSGILFFVVKYSQFGASENQGRNTDASDNSSRPSPPSGPSGNWPRGGGYRLGNS